MRCPILLVCSATLLLFPTPLVVSQQSQPVGISVDSDLDALNDELEQSLLQTFMPTFMTDPKKCSAVRRNSRPA